MLTKWFRVEKTQMTIHLKNKNRAATHNRMHRADIKNHKAKNQKYGQTAACGKKLVLKWIEMKMKSKKKLTCRNNKSHGSFFPYQRRNEKKTREREKLRQIDKRICIIHVLFGILHFKQCTVFFCLFAFLVGYSHFNLRIWNACYDIISAENKKKTRLYLSVKLNCCLN